MKPVDPNAITTDNTKKSDSNSKNEANSSNSAEDVKARMEQKFKSKKQIATEAAEASAYNDKLLLTEIIHSNKS